MISREDTIVRLKGLHELAASALGNESADRQATLETLELELGSIVNKLTAPDETREMADIAIILDLFVPVPRRTTSPSICPTCNGCKIGSECLVETIFGTEHHQKCNCN